MFLQYSHIFIVGIKGVAMVNLARILNQMGKHVTGSDSAEEFITDIVLKESNIQYISSFEADSLPQEIDLVIYSAAHGGIKNPQVIEAQKRGITVKHQIEVLGEILQEFLISIAVCGCHGKTTTSALLAHTLKQLDVKPSYMVGVSKFQDNYGGEYDGKDYFVIEADEYGLNPPHDKTPKLNYILPTHALCMNIDYDHPDVYENLEQTKETFLDFFQNILHNPSVDTQIPQLVFCADDDNLMAVAKELPREQYVTYGFNDSADVKITNLTSTEDETTFTLSFPKIATLSTFTIDLFGEKNVSNAAGIISLLYILGFDLADIQKAINHFGGVKRRFEKVAFHNNTYLFDDYGHHPHEIEATIQAARARFPSRRIIIIFQPHTFTRTESLKHEFVQALAKADQALIAPIFASAREIVTENAISAKDLQLLAEEKQISTIKGFDSKEELMTLLQKIIQKGDVIFTMGAGDIYKLKNGIISLL